MANPGNGAAGREDDHRDALPPAQHGTDAEELLAAHRELSSHALGYAKSMALKCALDLGIADTIHRRGGAATLDEILAAGDLPASSLPYLRRLMRALTTLRIFAVRRRDHPGGDDDDPAAAAAAAAVDVSYELTATSRLLLTDVGAGGSAGFSILPSIAAVVRQGAVSPMFGMAEWMKHRRAPAMSPYEMLHGERVWESVQANPAARARFHDAMDADARLVMHAVLGGDDDRGCGPGAAVFRGVTSLVDVGGGRGAAAAAVARAFPHIECTVMDLTHVVAAEAPAAAAGLRFVAGDMFEHIPPADALLLMWILHDWDDAKCIKILERCKEAISGNERRGKVIIIDTVIGNDDDMLRKEAQVLCDLGIMNMSNGGAEREEHEWRRIFLAAGFRDYKITQTRGIPSIIEVYP